MSHNLLGTKKNLPDVIYKLYSNSLFCPECRGILELGAVKSGFKKGHGQWRKLCLTCGMIYYDLVISEDIKI